MIRFKCKICGRMIEAADREAGQHTECPHCFRKALVPVPFYDVMRARVRQKRLEEANSDSQSQFEVPDTPPDCDIEKDLEEGYASESSWLVNVYFGEAALFAMTLAFLVLYAVEGQVRRDLYTLFRRASSGSALLASVSAILVVLPFVLGATLSIFHAFSKRKKSFVEKATMLFFAVAISAGTGLYAGWHILKTSSGLWFVVFAVWNLAYSVLLLLEFERIAMTDELDGCYVSDWDATLGQVLFASVTVLVVLLSCHYVFGLHWAITYSISATYATAMDKAVQKVFGVR